MPYVDENGSVMIDEVVANQDIAKLRSAREKLEEAKQNISSIIATNSTFSGPTSDAIEVSSDYLRRQVERQIQDVDSAIEYIQRLIRKYKDIDASLKEGFNSHL